jgi:hypothetical protein
MNGLMSSLDDLHDPGGMSWGEHKHRWTGAPGKTLDALTNDGFDECKREASITRPERDPGEEGGGQG